MSTPARIGLKFNTFEEMVADVDQLRSGPYQQAGKWNLAMILDHLAKTMNGPFGKGGKNIPWPVGPVVRYFFHRIAQRGIYPNFKIPAPKMIQPLEGTAIEKAHSEFLAVIGKVQAASGDTIQCQPFGNLRLDDFRKMQLLHGAHHLSFLKAQ